MTKRIIESTDLWIGVNKKDGDAHLFAGEEPQLDGSVYSGFLIAFLGPARLYGLEPGVCVRLMFETTQEIKPIR